MKLKSLHKIFFLCLTFFLLTGENSLKENAKNTTVRELSKFNVSELLDLQQFISQLISYQYDLSSLFESKDWDFPPGIDNPLDFRFEHDSLLNDSPFNIQKSPCENQYIQGIQRDLQSLLKARDRKERIKKFEKGLIGLGKLFPLIGNRIDQDNLEVLNALRDSTIQELTLEGEHFNRIIIYQELYPELLNIIEEVDSQAHCTLIIEAYIKAKSERLLIQATSNFFQKYQNHPLLTLLIPKANQRKELFEKVKQFRITQRKVSELIKVSNEEKLEELILDYRRLSVRYQKELRNDILFFVKQILNKSVEIAFSKVAQEGDIISDSLAALGNNLFQKSILSSAIKLSFQKTQIPDLNNSVGNHYFDFQKPIVARKEYQIWGRLRFNDIEWNAIIDENISKVEGTNPELYLVIVPNTGSSSPKIPRNSKSNSFGVPTDKSGSIGEIYLEVPLHVRIEQVDVLKDNKDQSLSGSTELFVTDDERLEDYAINLELPDIGLMTRFNYEIGLMNDVIGSLGLAKSLGLVFDKVGIVEDPTLGWDVELFFSWRPLGIFKDIARRDPQALSFSIRLSEINKSANELTKSAEAISKEYIVDARDVMRRIIMDRITSKLGRAANENRQLLAPVFLADSILEIRISSDSSRTILLAEIDLIPYGVNGTILANNLKPVRVIAKMGIDQGLPSFSISKPSVPLAAFLKERLREEFIEGWIMSQKDSIQEWVNQIESLSLTISNGQIALLCQNVVNDLAIKNFTIDIEKKSMCGEVQLGSSSINIPFCIYRDGAEVDLSILWDEFALSLTKYMKENIEALLVDYLSGSIEDYLNDFCASSVEKTFTFFGLTFKTITETKKCVDGVATVEANLINSNSNTSFRLKVAIDASGKVKITEYDSETLNQVLIDHFILNNENIPRDISFIKLRNERFVKEKEHLAVDLIGEFPFFSQEILIGEITIALEDGSISINSKDFGEDFLKKEIYQHLQKEINQILKGFDVGQLNIDFGEYAGVEITEPPAITLSSSQQVLTLNGIVRLAYGDIKIPILASLDLKSGKLNVDVNTQNITALIGAIQGQLGSFLSSTFSLGGLNLQVKLNPDGITSSPIGIKGELILGFPGLFDDVSIGFWINQHEFELNLDSKITFNYPTAIPTVGGAFICSPTIPYEGGPALQISLSGKEISFLSAITLAQPANARLLKVDGEVRLNLEEVSIGYTGVLIAGEFLPLMTGEGKLEVKNPRFTMSQKTSGLISDVVNFQNEVLFDAKKKYTKATANLGVLGIKLSAEMEAFIRESNLGVGGRGTFNFLGTGGFELGANTLIEPENPISPTQNAKVSLRGGLKIGGFDLSSVRVNANIKQAQVSFSVLGTSLGFTSPTISEISEGKFLELILGLFDFDPRVILELLKDPSKLKDIKIKPGPMGFGKSSGGESENKGSSGGKGDNEGGEETGGGKTAGEQVAESDVESDGGKGKSEVIIEPCTLPPCSDENQSELSVFRYSLKRFSEYSEETKRNFRERINGHECSPNLDLGSSDFSEIVGSKYQKVDNTIEFTPYEQILPPIGGSGGRLYDPNQVTQTKFGHFLIRVGLETYKVEYDNQCYICLSEKGYPLVNPKKFCTPVDCELPGYSVPTHTANLAVKGNSIHLFVGVDFYNESFCNVGGSRAEKITEPVDFAQLASGEISSSISCNDCELFEITSSGINLMGNFNSSNTFSLGSHYSVQGSRRQIVPVDDELQEFDDFVNGFLQNNAFSEKTIRRFIRSAGIKRGDILVPISETQFLRINRFSDVAVSSTKTVNPTRDLLRNEAPMLSAKVWQPINPTHFKSFFPTIDQSLPAEQFIEAIGTQLDQVTFDQCSIQLGEYIKRWLRFGEEPNLDQIPISDPSCLLRVWPYPRQSNEDRWKIDYIFLRSPEGKYSINDNIYQLESSELLEILEVDPSLEGQKELLTNRNHIFKNFLFNRIANRLGEKLLFANQDSLVYVSATTGELSYKIFTTKTLEPESREKDQIVLMDGISLGGGGGRESFIPNLQEGTYHHSFYNNIFSKTLRDTSTIAFVGEFPGDHSYEHYRSVIFYAKDSVEITWEAKGETIGELSEPMLKSLTLSYEAIQNHLIDARNSPRYYPRVRSVSEEMTKQEIVDFIFCGFDGFNEWYPQDRIHPLFLVK